MAKRLQALAALYRDGLTWVHVDQQDFIALEDAAAVHEVLVALTSQREAQRLSAPQAFQTHWSEDLGKAVIFVRTVPVTPRWAGIALFHELSHAYDFISGIEPHQPDRGQFLAGEARGARPASTSACWHHPRRVSGLTPTRGPIRFTAACSDSSRSCSRASVTRRTARSRNSFGYFLGAGTGPLSRGLAPCTRPDTVQPSPSHTSTRGTPPSSLSSAHQPANRSSAARLGTSRADSHRE